MDFQLFLPNSEKAHFPAFPAFLAFPAGVDTLFMEEEYIQNQRQVQNNLLKISKLNDIIAGTLLLQRILILNTIDMNL